MHSSSQFATTRWTLVWQAAASQEPQGKPALEELLRRYWMPLYAFARQRGLQAEDAEDATQEFLARVADGQWLLQADPARGKFRTYLLTAWRSFLIDSYRRGQAQRRGGQIRFQQLDWAAGESNWQRQQPMEPVSSEQAPDQAFMIAWAHGLLDACREQLREEYASRGKPQYFDVLAPLLTAQVTGGTVAQIASQLGITASAAKVALHRLRQRFASKMRQLVMETLDNPEDVEAELGELLTLLCR